MPREEMLRRMSSAEITEWMAYNTLEPFGGETNYFGHAITAATVANVNRGKRQRAYKVEDFMPKFKKKAQTPDEMLQVAQMLTMGLGGQDLREPTTDPPTDSIAESRMETD